MSSNVTAAVSPLPDEQKRSQIATILQEQGYKDDKHIDFVTSRVTRTETGGLAGVGGAVESLKRVFPSPNAPEAKATSYRPVNLPPSRDYTQVSEADASTARYYFSPAGAGAANQLAMQQPQEYRRIKTIARKLGLLA